jgi:membrane protease YdiL (CAAX protease family)
MSPGFLVSAMIGGFAPSLSALLTQRLSDGGAAAATLLKRLAAWPSLGDAALALLLAPILAAISWLVLGGAFQTLQWPDIAALLPVLLLWPLVAALGEELGWRGYLYPRLMPALGPIGAAVAVGLIWGLWHLPADYVGLKASGGWFWLAFLVNGPFVLTGHALVMAWLWRWTEGNLVAMVLYHVGITASAISMPSPGPDALMQVTAAAIGGLVVWAGAGALWLFAPRRN